MLTAETWEILPRSRFLGALDEMMRQDQQGAVDDMLKVLRERGVIAKVSGVATGPVEYKGDPNYTSYASRKAVQRVADEMLEAGAVAFSDRTEERDGHPWQKRYVIEGTVELVRPRRHP